MSIEEPHPTLSAEPEIDLSDLAKPRSPVRRRSAPIKRPIKQCSNVLMHNAHEWEDHLSPVMFGGDYHCLGLMDDEPLTTEGVLRDYFINDREGWKRGYGPWAERAKKVLGL